MTEHGPILAVLPPQTARVEERDGLLAQGLMEDVCGALARFPALRVIAWTSVMAVAHLPDREAGVRLGATHVLRSRVERAREGLRVAMTLIDCADGAQLWSESLKSAADDPYALQEEVVGRIAATLATQIEQHALAAARRKSRDSLATYELVLRGLARLRRGTPESDEEARELFNRALEVDPDHARALAGLSLSYFNEWSCQFWDRFEEHGRLAYHYAHRALELDDRDAMLHVIIGRIHLYHRRFEQASWYFDRSLALCPNDADNLIQLCICQAYLGRPRSGMELAERAVRLNPYHPNWYHAYAALPYFVDRQFEKALEVGGRAGEAPIVDMPAFTAVALAHLGRVDEAREHMAAYHQGFRRLITFGREPGPGEPIQWVLDINPFRRPEDVDMIVEGFRLLDQPGAISQATGQPDGPRAGDGPREASLTRQGAGWVVKFAGGEAVLPDLKGIHDIRRLLERPGDEVHCLDLAGRGAEADDGGDVLDDRARHELHVRIRDLQEELSEAEDRQDLGRAERAREELDRLVEALSSALDLRGRPRRLGSLTERARTAVTWRIRHAVGKIQSLHEPLGRHLSNSVRTGTFCAYRPERAVRWRL
jgi:TolB-like protein